MAVVKVFSSQLYDFCKVCNEFYSYDKLCCCKYHNQPLIISKNGFIGTFECCGNHAFRPKNVVPERIKALDGSYGCQIKSHIAQNQPGFVSKVYKHNFNIVNDWYVICHEYNTNLRKSPLENSEIPCFDTFIKEYIQNLR